MFLFFALLSTAEAQLYNGLKVTWDVNPFGDYVFADIPRTVADAKADGWNLNTACGAGDYFQGERYIRYDDVIGRDDPAVMPLYDVNGYIAGIQTAVPMQDGYPYKKIIPPFNFDAGLKMYTLTAYFVEQSIICTSGRDENNFRAKGTGDRIVVLNGTDLAYLPSKEADAAAAPGLTVGKCLPTMGQHYWYDMDKPCDEITPFFLMYNDGILNSFGWSFHRNYDSPRYEHPTSDDLGTVMPDNYPQCLNELEISTLHIYLTKNPQFNFCSTKVKIIFAIIVLTILFLPAIIITTIICIIRRRRRNNYENLEKKSTK